MNKVQIVLEEEKLSWRRSAINVLVDMLVVALKGAKKTDIVYKTNLNFKVAKKYLDFLLAKGLITAESLQGRRKVYRTTEKGKLFIKRYRETVELIL